jgi:GntR family transcriptional regulator / MocR family aminotransferase
MRLHEARWLALGRRPGETLRAGLERSLREAILDGALRPGMRLPSSRVLANQVDVSRGVVSDAYAQLESQGFLISRARASPVVASVRRPETSQPRPEAAVPAPRYDLTPTTPDVTLFPLRRWLAATQHVSRTEATTVLDYREPRGERGLREALADHLGRTRGAVTDPSQIVVVQGTAQGFDLLVRVLATRGASRIATEDPSLTRQHERIRALGLSVVAQPVDSQGLIVEGLDADAVVVTPAHQFPTGSVLSGERRRQLLDWACAVENRLIIEDDYDSEFRYDREPVRCLQALDPYRVVQLGSVSKTLAPALRLGWLVLPPELVDAAERTKRLLDDFSPALGQLTLARFMATGDYDRHLRRCRAVYRARRDRVLAALAEHLPELAVAGVAAGMHLLLRLPPGVDDTAIAEAAEAESLRVPALSAFRVAPSDAGGLVIGYGRVREGAAEPAIEALAKIVRAGLSR